MDQMAMRRELLAGSRRAMSGDEHASVRVVKLQLLAALGNTATAEVRIDCNDRAGDIKRSHEEIDELTAKAAPVRERVATILEAGGEPDDDRMDLDEIDAEIDTARARLAAHRKSLIKLPARQVFEMLMAAKLTAAKPTAAKPKRKAGGD